MISRILLTALLVLTLSSCSDTTGPTDDTHRGSSFTVTALSEDSAYLNEPLWLEYKNGPAHLRDLSLFVHTVPVALDSLVGNRLYFRVPEGAETSSLRLFQYGDQLANGSLVLFIFEKGMDNYYPFVKNMWPIDGYEGDLVTIEGLDFPPRVKDLAVTFNGKPSEIVYHNSEKIQVHVPQGDGTVAVEIQSFGKTVNKRTFSYHSSDLTFLKSNQLTSIGVTASGLLGKIKTIDHLSNTVTLADTSIMWAFADQLTTTKFQRLGDSLFVTAQHVGIADSAFVQFHLQVDEQRNSISGTIRLYRIIERGTESEAETDLTLRVSDLRWKSGGWVYDLYAYGFDIGKKITTLEYSYRSKADQWSTEFLEFTGGVNEGVFAITLE